MSRKAVDVVLLPDEQMTDIAGMANAKLVKRFGDEIVLDKENCLPHISLAMGCIDDEQISGIEAVLRENAERNPLGKLEILAPVIGTNAVGEKVTSLEVKRTAQLQKLHEDVMKAAEPLFGHDVTEDMIYGEDEVAESTLTWVRDYRDKSSFSKFRPHITIGYGQFEGNIQPQQFEAKELALCHLGNHCTCRKILTSVPI